jgi:hypothetical protein
MSINRNKHIGTHRSEIFQARRKIDLKSNYRRNHIAYKRLIIRLTSIWMKVNEYLQNVTEILLSTHSPFCGWSLSRCDIRSKKDCHRGLSLKSLVSSALIATRKTSPRGNEQNSKQSCEQGNCLNISGKVKLCLFKNFRILFKCWCVTVFYYTSWGSLRTGKVKVRMITIVLEV